MLPPPVGSHLGPGFPRPARRLRASPTQTGPLEPSPPAFAASHCGAPWEQGGRLAPLALAPTFPFADARLRPAPKRPHTAHPHTAHSCPPPRPAPLSPQVLEEFKAEVSIMKRLRHPNIIQFVSGRAGAACRASATHPPTYSWPPAFTPPARHSPTRPPADSFPYQGRRSLPAPAPLPPLPGSPTAYLLPARHSRTTVPPCLLRRWAPAPARPTCAS